MKPSKLTIILALASIVLFIAALVSVYVEKNKVADIPEEVSDVEPDSEEGKEVFMEPEQTKFQDVKITSDVPGPDNKN